MSQYDVPPPRRNRGQLPIEDLYAAYGGRDSAADYGDRGGRRVAADRRFREPADGYQRPRREPAPEEDQRSRPRRPESRRAGSTDSPLVFEVLGAIALVGVTAAITWVAAAHHFENAAGSTQHGTAAEPATAAGAVAAARQYFALYRAGEYAALYPMIAPADRAVLAETVWTGLQRTCAQAKGLRYSVSHPVLSGATASMSVAFAGASANGTEQVTFTYSGGRWYYAPPDMQVYRGHDVAQAVVAAKAAGQCS